MVSDENRPTVAARLRRAAIGAGGWALTVVGVLIILIVIGGEDTTGWLSSAYVVVSIVVGVCAVIPIVLGAAYLLVRGRNRAAEAAGEQVSPRAHSTQTGLASLLDRLGGSLQHASGLRRTIVEDRVRITAATLADLPSPEERLAFLSNARPSQATDFIQSRDFLSLTRPDQDAVVLLDLRRELLLRGTAIALGDEPGFYHHAPDRILEAASRTYNRELDEAVRSARRAVLSRAALPDAGELVGLLDAEETWRRYRELST